MGFFNRAPRRHDDPTAYPAADVVETPAAEEAPAKPQPEPAATPPEPEPVMTAEPAAQPAAEPAAQTAAQTAAEPAAPSVVPSFEPPEPEAAEPTVKRASAPTPPPVNQVEPADDDHTRISVAEALAPMREPARPRVGDPVAAAAEPPQRRAKIISFANQKGGVAKTTTTLNLAVAFKESGHDVLVVDLDPQGNLTMSQGIDPDKVDKSMYDVLVHHIPIKDVILEREIDIAVASIDLAGAEIAMSAQIGRERSLEKAFKAVEEDYDFICIDTPPSLGLLTVNALTASDKVIVPVQCEYLSMRGLVQLQNTLEMIRENLNPRVVIEGILPTMLDSRTVHAKEAVEILEENFGELVFKSRIRKAIKFAEAPVRGASVLKYDPKSNAANYYRELAQEVLTHNGA
jgi:chromosome partitioning protein